MRNFIVLVLILLLNIYVNLVHAETMAQVENAPTSYATEEDNIGASEIPEMFTPQDIPVLAQFDAAMDEYLNNDPRYLLKPAAANPKILIHIDKANQKMTVLENGRVKFRGWKISTGFARGYETRNGNFTPFEMNKNYFSKRFQVVLPYGIKFDGGNLIHAASRPALAHLGKKHSHGCVRVHPANAKVLFEMVRQAGMKNTRVVVTNSVFKDPAAPAVAKPATKPNVETAALPTDI